MYDKFILTIDLGNAEMCERHHVADALRKVTDSILNNDDYDSKNIKDVNGNTVGRWKFVKE